jgi:hypothetical protein
MVADSRFGPPAVRRLEQDADGFVELLLRGHHVAELKLAFARLEVIVGGRDQRRDRIFYGLRWQ